MINNFGERLRVGFENASYRVANSLFKPLGVVAVGAYGGIEGGYEGYDLMHDSIPYIPTHKAGDVMVCVLEGIASAGGAAAGFLVGVGAGILVMDAVPGKR